MMAFNNGYLIFFFLQQVYKSATCGKHFEGCSQIFLQLIWSLNKTYPAHDWESNTRTLVRAKFWRDIFYVFIRCSYTLFTSVLIAIFIFLLSRPSCREKRNTIILLCTSHWWEVINLNLIIVKLCEKLIKINKDAIL